MSHVKKRFVKPNTLCGLLSTDGIRDQVQTYLTTQDQINLRKTNGALYRLYSKLIFDVLKKPMNVDFLKNKISMIRQINIDKVNGLF
eukprot:UN23787